MFTKEDVVLFSRVQGRVLFNGIPVANAKVIRRYRYDTPQPIEDSCITNGQGEFELPVVVKKMPLLHRWHSLLFISSFMLKETASSSKYGLMAKCT